MGDREDIYKDLMYTQSAYYSGEEIFPQWENIYAIIVSAFLIFYFSSSNTLNFLPKLFLILVGFIFSFSWFQLVSRNHLNSEARWNRLMDLEKALQKDVSYNTTEGTEKLMLFTLSEYEQKFISNRKGITSILRTWTLRKVVPGSLAIIWIILLILLSINHAYIENI